MRRRRGGRRSGASKVVGWCAAGARRRRRWVRPRRRRVRRGTRGGVRAQLRRAESRAGAVVLPTRTRCAAGWRPRAAAVAHAAGSHGCWRARDSVRCVSAAVEGLAARVGGTALGGGVGGRAVSNAVTHAVCGRECECLHRTAWFELFRCKAAKSSRLRACCWLPPQLQWYAQGLSNSGAKET